MSVKVWRLDQAAVIHELEQWAQTLGQSDPTVSKVLLFGSLARGDATPLSDADVVILLRSAELDFASRIAHFTPTGLSIPVDVFPYTLAEAREAIRDGWGMVPIAIAEGRCLFTRDDDGLDD